MAILELFSTRRRKEGGEAPDVFIYDALPKELRVQVMLIVRDGLGALYSSGGYATPAYSAYREIVEQLVRHFGRQRLAPGDNDQEILCNFFLQEQNVESWLDALELSCGMMQAVGDGWEYKTRSRTKLTPDDATADLNHRFLQHGVGYQYVSGKIIQYDSQFLHAEVVKPAMDLLQDQTYQGANDEFLRAHQPIARERSKIASPTR